MGMAISSNPFATLIGQATRHRPDAARPCRTSFSLPFIPSRITALQTLPLALLATLALVSLPSCNLSTGAGDYMLFGMTGESTANTCAANVAVTQTQIALVEDGDQNKSGTDTNGGTAAWGYYEQEFCVYPTQAFTGTVTFPITVTNPYLLIDGTTSRLSLLTSSPVAGNPMPASISFTGSGVGNQQCFVIARTAANGIQDPRVSSAATINIGLATVSDSGNVYKSSNPCDVSITLEDDAGPGVRVSSMSNIMQEPPGGSPLPSSGTFLVRLRTIPSDPVTIPINDIYDATNAGHREGTASPTSLTFAANATATNDQTVTITSVDDLEVDGTKTYTVELQNAQSSDPDYSGLKPRNVVVINNDKSVPGYTYTLWDATGGSTSDSSGATVNGFASDEMVNMGSTYSKFKMKLRSKPSANVTLNFSSNNTAVSNVQTTSLTFTPSNWNVDQWVYVTGKSDGLDNGNTDYNITFTVSTTDTTYSSIPKPTFVMRSCDNDASHLIQPCNFSGASFGTSGSRLAVSEPATTNYIWLITKSAPGSTITVPLTSGDTTEGTVPANVTIDGSTYNTLTSGGANRILITAVDDSLLDGSINWIVTTGAASGGSTYDTSDVYATTNDNEQRYYIKVTGSTKENTPAQTATIDICLGADNSGDVTITAACSGAECNSGFTPAGIAPASVTFTAHSMITAGTPSNTACATDPNRKTFTITGGDDPYADGTVSYNITLTASSSDTTFDNGSGHSPGSQSVSNADDEQPGKAIFVTSGTYLGEMTLAGVGGADNYCSTAKPAWAPTGTYKALIVSDGTTKRIATTNGTTSAGQVGWVLSPNYYYYSCNASGAASCSDQYTRLFVANSAGLIPFPMQNASGSNVDFSSNGADEFWTGMLADLTAATQSSTPAQNVGDPAYRDNCAGWTYQNAPVNPFPTYYGQTWTKNGAGFITSNTNVACTTQKKLICVQQ